MILFYFCKIVTYAPTVEKFQFHYDLILFEGYDEKQVDPNKISISL